MKNRIDAIIEFYRTAARLGKRCPTRADQKKLFGHIRFDESPAHLARQGLLTRVEIYGKNWRVIEVDGMRTAPFEPMDGHKAEPYRIIDKSGDNLVRK